MRSTWRIETMVLPELSWTVANTTCNPVNRLASKQLHLNHVVPERPKGRINLYIKLKKHKLDQIAARNILRASAWETGADSEMKVSQFRLKLVHKVVMWTYVIRQSFMFNDLLLADFLISAPQGSPRADFQCNFGQFSISLLATYN